MLKVYGEVLGVKGIQEVLGVKGIWGSTRC